MYLPTCVSLYVHMYARMYVCALTPVSTYYAHRHIYIHTHTHTSMCVCVCVYVGLACVARSVRISVHTYFFL